MGKIKTKLIKRTGNALMKEIKFNEEFEKNKKILGREMESKKVRNQIAGFISRIKRREREDAEKLEKELTAVKK